MNFLDALKSGRPMRRRSWWRDEGGDRWLVLDPDGEWWWLGAGGGDANPPTRADMLAEDWEVSLTPHRLSETRHAGPD